LWLKHLAQLDSQRITTPCCQMCQVQQASVYQDAVDFDRGWYEKTTFVQAKAGGTNKWGVKNPVGHALSFDYEPATFGAGFIRNSNTQTKVCGATMSDGGASWPVADARELPIVFNMLSKNYRDHADYLEKTLEVAFDQTMCVAEQLKITQNAVDVLQNGVEANGLQILQQKFQTLGTEVARLQSEVQKKDVLLKESERQLKLQKAGLSELQALIAESKSKHETTKDHAVVLAPAMNAVEKRIEDLELAQTRLGKTVQQQIEIEKAKKCCIIQ